MKLIRYIFLVLLLPALSVGAQTVNGVPVHVSNRSIAIGGNKQLMVGMDVALPAALRLTTNEAAVFTPVLKSKDGLYNKVLPAIWVYGRIRAIVHERGNALPTDAYTILRRKNGQQQVVNYSTRLEYESWMNGAELELISSVSGCADCLKEENAAPIAVAHLERYVAKPLVAFVAPEVEEVKNRAEQGSAFLDFPVNQTVIYPDYRRNTDELARIKATVDVVKNDTNTHITKIDIKGHASPESSYAHNKRLAIGRSEALKKYVMKEYGFKEDLFRVSAEPEDWAGLRKYVETSSLEHRSEILALIDSDRDPDAKEWKLKSTYPSEYQFLLKNCYPALRHSDYVVHYVVRGFHVEEAKRIIRERPQQLSLQEMFLVAQTYEKGTEEFGEVFDIAVRMFPEDATANINAAAVALQKNDWKMAERYLSKSKADAPATLNNQGVLKMMQGDLDAAEVLLKQAQAAGSAEAETNLKELANKRMDIQMFGE